MNRPPYVLTIDCGTQSLRAMIFDAAGDLAAFEKLSYTPYIEQKPGYAEEDTELYWASLLSVLEKLREHNPALFKWIEGVGVTAQRDTMVCLEENGKPLRNAIIWLDQR
jgi:sugar (pentulose or hexulose) kinase